MFEDSLVTSQVGGGNAGRTRGTVAVSLAVQGLMLTAFVVAPLLFPATLPVVIAAPRLASLSLRKPEPRPQPKPVIVRVTNQAAVRAPSATAPTVAPAERRGGMISRAPLSTGAEEAPTIALGGGMGHEIALGSGAGPGPASDAAAVRVVPAAVRPTGPTKVSSGVSAGLLLSPITPQYPAIAKAAHISGTVVLTAIIDRAGHITGLQVVSGPEMLRRAALEAVQAARYHPFQLNGEATEVITTVSVVFRMEG